MQKIGSFEKVSFEQFEKDWIHTYGNTGNVREIYERICLPSRATKGSAGYDFHAPVDIDLEPGCSALIPSGIRARIADGWVLMIFPRSGLGFRYRMQLDNTVGIIDADYYDAENEGHIMVKITNDSREGKPLHIEQGRGLVQGIFLPFGIVEDDAAEGIRKGGFGSTEK